MIIGYYIGIAVLILSFVFSLIITKKFVKAKTQFIRIVFSMLIMVLTTSVMTVVTVSVENLFCRFDTAESAFHFNHSQEIIDIAEGDSSCMVIYKKNNHTIGVYYLYKSDTNYKISNVISSKRVKSIPNKNISFSVNQVVGTNDYYINGFTLLKENIVCKSNQKNDSVNKLTVDSNINNEKTFFIYDYIGDYEANDCYLMINDEKIDIK